MMQAAGTLYLSGQAPVATRAADGTFVLTLLAIDQYSEDFETPWLLTWCGPEAEVFHTFNADYLTESQPINVRVSQVKTFCNARFGSAEVHAKADRISINWFLSTTARQCLGAAKQPKAQDITETVQ